MKFLNRYADEILLGNEVLVEENDQLKAAQVKKISNFLMQGNYNL